MAEEKMVKEKIFNIPLREAYKKSVRKRSPYATRILRDYLKQHTKAEEVKIGSKLNEAIWARGMKHPARKVRVKVVMEGNVAKAELMGFDYKDFKATPKMERKGTKEKLMERLGPKALKKEEEEKAVEGKETPEHAQKQTHDSKESLNVG